jgi:hypothetical protein
MTGHLSDSAPLVSGEEFLFLAMVSSEKDLAAGERD